MPAGCRHNTDTVSPPFCHLSLHCRLLGCNIANGVICSKVCISLTGMRRGPKPPPETPIGISRTSVMAFHTRCPMRSPSMTVNFMTTSRPLLPVNTTTLPFRQEVGAMGSVLHGSSTSINKQRHHQIKASAKHCPFLGCSRDEHTS